MSSLSKLTVLLLLIFSGALTIHAQSSQTQAQRDATLPPGRAEQSLPPEVQQGGVSDPTKPPGTQEAAPSFPAEPPPPLAPRPAQPAPTPFVNTEDSSEAQTPSRQRRAVPPVPILSRAGVNSGEALPLSLNETVRMALENSNEIEMARNNARLAESYSRSLQGQYDPVLLFTPQFTRSVSPQTSPLSGAGASGTSARSQLDFGSSIVKRWSTGGGQYEVFFNNSRITSTSTTNSFSPLFSSSFGLTFTQPLMRERAIDLTRREIRIQRKRLEQSDADFRQRTIEVIVRVQRAYWELAFALRDRQNQLANLNLARENFRRAEAGIAIGAAAPLGRAEVQTELSNREAALLVASQNVTLAENNLKILILSDPLAKEWSSALIPTDDPTFDMTPVNLQDALVEARASRPEMRRLRLEQDINDIDLQYFEDQTRPRLDLGATVSTTGLAGSPMTTVNPLTSKEETATVPGNLTGGYGQMLRNLIGLDTHNLVVGVTLEIPLRNRLAQENLGGARIERDQLAAARRNQEQVIEVEVRNATEILETARRRVLAARAARESAEMQLNGERRLYEVGRTTMFLLFQRENQLVNTRSQELRAETDYNKALAELQRATSTTLRVNNVIIETPLSR